MKIGQRVKVSIEAAFTSGYAMGVVDKINGATGIVEGYNPRSINGRKWLSPAALVAFDVPVESSVPGSMHTHFWFPVEDLREV